MTEVKLDLDELTKLQDAARPFTQWRVEYNGEEYLVETRTNLNGADMEFRYAPMRDLPTLTGEARTAVIDHIQNRAADDANVNEALTEIDLH